MTQSLTILPASAPAALQAFAASPLMRDTRGNAEIAVSAFTELSAACNLHLDAKATTPEHFSEILEVLALSFPSFRISEISPAFRAYSAGLLDIAEEDMKTYGQPLKPAQVRKIFAGYQAHHFALAKKLEAAQAPQLTPEQEMQADIDRLNAERLADVEAMLSGVKPAPEKWGLLVATDCKALMELRPDWFAAHKEQAFAAAKSIPEKDVVEAHYGYTLLSLWDIEKSYWTREYGEHGATYAIYAKLAVWMLLQEKGVAPAVIEAALQEGGQHERA
jgi:hypothetical protein